MDFFDKLSKKASETYKLTKEKTSQISGELKLRNKMNNSKDRIDELYSEIGKIVYEAHKKNEELSKDDIRPKCEEIARHLKAKQAAVVNLHRLQRDFAQRTIDFLTGVVFALDGTIQKIGHNVILCAPKNVAVSGEIKIDSDDD